MTPELAAAKILAGRHAFISHAAPQSLAIAAKVCQSFAVDNGAFSAWRSGKPIKDWNPFYEWVSQWEKHPGFDWFLIPDVIDGTERDNDNLIYHCPNPRFGVPIWHLHESLDRLRSLARDWPRVALGSSGEYRTVNTKQWHSRMVQVMRVVCDDAGRPCTRLHGLRMLNPDVFKMFPFASADSTNVARNMSIEQRWTGTYPLPSPATRGEGLASRIEHYNSASHWVDDSERRALDLFQSLA